MTAFGTAMEKTGTAAFLAGHVVRLLEPFGVMTILGGFCLLTIVLTQPMSNAAAALVVLPVALNTASLRNRGQSTRRNPPLAPPCRGANHTSCAVRPG